MDRKFIRVTTNYGGVHAGDVYRLLRKNRDHYIIQKQGRPFCLFKSMGEPYVSSKKETSTEPTFHEFLKQEWAGIPL